MGQEENNDDNDERVMNLRKYMEKAHKPARGRQRRHQLAAMTAEERQVEREILMEKNRQSARDCRLRKKSHVASLKATIQEQEDVLAQDKLMIAQLKQENATMYHELARLRKYVESKQRREKPRLK